MEMSDRAQSSSHFVDVDGRSGHYRLHLKRWHRDPLGPPVLALHGSIEDGRIFYSATGKGLAPWLAGQGFDVYVADLRGCGRSIPSISWRTDHGQTDAIVEELPALGRWLARRRPDRDQTWIAHSWGGVLSSAALVRDPVLARQVRGQVLFGTKRAITVFNLDKLLQYNLAWSLIGGLATRWLGYLPARRLGLGAEDEPRQLYLDTCHWADPRHPWRDTRDGFDYRAAARQTGLPPTLWLAGASDRFLGHVDDVRRFLRECAGDETWLHVLGRARGQARDYGHIDMLTDPGAPDDHFPAVARWLRAPGRDPWRGEET